MSDDAIPEYPIWEGERERDRLQARKVVFRHVCVCVRSVLGLGDGNSCRGEMPEICTTVKRHCKSADTVFREGRLLCIFELGKGTIELLTTELGALIPFDHCVVRHDLVFCGEQQQPIMIHFNGSWL